MNNSLIILLLLPIFLIIWLFGFNVYIIGCIVTYLFIKLLLLLKVDFIIELKEDEGESILLLTSIESWFTFLLLIINLLESNNN